MSKSKNHDFPPNLRNIKARPDFFIFKARIAFIKLKQIFLKALILHYFNTKCHIQIETNVSRYAIRKILSQLTLNDLG